MKLAISALIIGSATAFAPAQFGIPRSSTALFDTTPVDSSSAVKDAQAASKKYGATSKEARIAWEIVEEMDSSNSHVKSPAGIDPVVPNDAEFPVQKKQVAAPKDESAEYTAALAEAKALTEEHGISSSQARVA